jgi:CubicO group peptidase (beta-lactamase class C family)
VLSEAWVRTSWRIRTRSPFSGHDYGYGWFLAQAGSHQVAYARGYGGQLLYVVPSLRLTVVITSDTDRPARSRGYAGQLNDLMAEVIMPAAGMAAL